MNPKIASDVDGYIGGCSKEQQPLLHQIRALIKKAAPEAEECISYGMPAYKLSGPLVYFAACKNHIGLYPTGDGIQAFASRLGNFKYSKGAVQFPLNKPLPVALITSMVKHRVRTNKKNAKTKSKKI